MSMLGKADLWWGESLVRTTDGLGIWEKKMLNFEVLLCSKAGQAGDGISNSFAVGEQPFSKYKQRCAAANLLNPCLLSSPAVELGRGDPEASFVWRDR